MVKANELRIGNLFLVNKHYELDCRNGEITTEGSEQIIHNWKLRDFSICNNFPQHLNEFYPIPLTPEILERAGFQYWVKEWYRISIGFNDLSIKPSVGVFGISFKGGREECIFENPGIDYVHQLQNLFNSLTGEELNVDIIDTTKSDSHQSIQPSQ